LPDPGCVAGIGCCAVADCHADRLAAIYGGRLLRWLPMPDRILRFCRKCLATREALSREVCETCGGELLPLFDSGGALCGEFLEARGTCCDTGCRNCPYGEDETSGGGMVRTITCPRCKEVFACRSTGCWCASVELSGDALEGLRRSYNDCLCPACLAEFARR
jgi:hypothetical protein